MAILQKQPYLEKTHVFSLILSLHLIVSAKTLCTVGINNCKANTPCNLTLQLCFLHESQNTRKEGKYCYSYLKWMVPISQM